MRPSENGTAGNPPRPIRQMALTEAVLLRGIGAILLITLVSAAIVGWQTASHREQEQLRNDLFWDSYLTAMFGMQGSWSGIAGRTLADKAADRSLGGLRLWDASLKPVFGPGSEKAAPDAIRSYTPILYQGEVVGYFDAAPVLKPSLSNWRTFALIAAAGAAGVCFFLALSRLTRRGETETRLHVLGRLRRLANDSSEAGNSRGEELTAGPSGSELDRDIESLLKQLETRIRKLEKVRKTMIADIAHELRTPLAVMRAQLENALVRQTPLAPESLVLLHDEVYRMTKLVHDLQQLALAESGHLPLEKRWFSLRALTASVIDAVMAAAEENGCRISVDCPGETRTYGDESRIQQVLVNIIGNAVRHSRTSVHIAVAGSERQTVIRITDDGMGIEEEELPHVFERFYRGSRKTGKADAMTGLGLGLAIVKEFVEAHKGTVSVSSDWGKHTTFAVVLPVFPET
ncbi:sensor histidine kinase [Paenibacillus sp. MBLB4367]|uniref:sensor histidine kinase n=1 Tax=Paenibacillus sp. MBLB4367 TaxID=3384767 RepID=UPI0039083624